MTEKTDKPFFRFLVNATQTPEERRFKYRYYRNLGFSVKESRQMRDWAYDCTE